MMSDKTHTGPDLGSESSHFAPAHRVTMVCSSIVSAPISHHQTHEVTNDTAAYMQHVVGHACSFDLMRRVSVIPLATNAPIAAPATHIQAGSPVKNRGSHICNGVCMPVAIPLVLCCSCTFMHLA